MNKTLKIVAIALIAIIGTVGVAYAIGQFNLTLPSNGVVSDSYLVASPSQIDWGTIAQGASVQKSFNLTNISTQTTAPLNLTVASEVGTVNWNIETLQLPANATIVATITLTVYENATNGAFELPLYIKG